MSATDIMTAKILVVDDEKNIVTVLKAILEKRGFSVEGFTSPREALSRLEKEEFDVVVTDLYMPDLDGMALLSEIHRLHSGLPVVMITAFGTVDSAVDAIKKGAFDYVTKPFEQSEIVSVVQKAVNTRQFSKIGLKGDAKTKESNLAAIDSYILKGSSSSISQVAEKISKIASTPSVVLLKGEVGSGKEVLAEEIHFLSTRAYQPLLKVNCEAVTSLNLETEVFGGQKIGKLEMAHKGSLYLDEVSEMSLELQHKLFDFLESGSFEHPLRNEKITVDVRIIASTSKDLLSEVRAGNFREDLYYKLNVFPIEVPSLKERISDLSDLSVAILEKLEKKLHRSGLQLENKALKILSEYSWPGNLRQLEQVLERMVINSKGSVLLEADIPKDMLSDRAQMEEDHHNFREVIRKRTQNLERELIEKAMSEMEGNVTRTAEYLGISRKGLQLKIKELGIKN
ncbi:MAG: sigma-54 dependent transcriptional regulator [Oligoflexia bacterium]|nr:sigma-54 dependent transcriptional regulator [Oligoflexia bacterium]